VLDPGVLERLSDAAAKRARSSIGGSRPGLLGGASATQRLARAHGSGAAPTALGGVGGGVGSQGAGSGVGAVSAAPSAGALDDDMVASARRAAKPVAKDESASAPPGGYARPPAGWKGGAASPSSGAASRTAAPPAVAATGGAVAPPPAPAPAAPAARSSGAAASRAQTVPTRRALGKRDVVNDALAEGEATGGSAHAGAAPESDVLRQEEKAEKAERADEDKRARVESTGKVSDEPRARALKKAAPAPAKSADATSEDDKERKPDEGASREALARRADELFAARRWSDAIAAYRELLRRYPEADLKARWRARITRAQAATEAPTDGADRAAAKAATTSRGSTKAKSEPQPAPAE